MLRKYSYAAPDGASFSLYIFSITISSLWDFIQYLEIGQILRRSVWSVIFINSRRTNVQAPKGRHISFHHARIFAVNFFTSSSASALVCASAIMRMIGSVFDFLRCTHDSGKSIFNPSSVLIVSLTE